ncbi:hypothetical protein FNF31_05799 [Cafeteria roenbergensis]|uniref:Uncharacterized protein n=1 Tax=Cafeteria roenbergensis TaxID=33653 RepID=A0A5A8CWR7_CAFRO|nr:hypothetical protein FNF31_05799 [Cafeteria roenbergensis]
MAAAAGAAPIGRKMHKVILLGDSQVGKSALTSRLRGGGIDTTSTLGVEFFTHVFKAEDGTTIGLDIWDTCGQERFRSITKQFIRHSSAVMLVYDVTCRDSFRHMHGWARRVRKEAPEAAIVLVGNKIDLGTKRTVTTEMGHEMATQFKVRLFETSAMTCAGVTEAFAHLAQVAEAAAVPSLPPTKSCPPKTNVEIMAPRPARNAAVA